MATVNAKFVKKIFKNHLRSHKGDKAETLQTCSLLWQLMFPLTYNGKSENLHFIAVHPGEPLWPMGLWFIGSFLINLLMKVALSRILYKMNKLSIACKYFHKIHKINSSKSVQKTFILFSTVLLIIAA